MSYSKLETAVNASDAYMREHPEDVADWAAEDIRNLLDDVLVAAQPVDAARTERDAAVLKLARDAYYCDGVLEIDDDAVISDGDENGAYVGAWVWVDFAGTPLDKDPEGAE